MFWVVLVLVVLAFYTSADWWNEEYREIPEGSGEKGGNWSFKHFSGWIWIFLTGFCSLSHSKKVTKYMNKMKFKVLDWPGCSPDSIRLRICDQSSSYAFAWRLYYKNKAYRGNNPDMVYRPRNQKKCLKLVDSMPNWVQQVPKNGGGHIMCYSWFTVSKIVL